MTEALAILGAVTGTAACVLEFIMWWWKRHEEV